MKVVKEHINEKFHEKGDPVRDMGIGTQRIILDMCKNIMRINLDEEGELQIIEIEVESSLILIKTNNPDWPVIDIASYLYNIFKKVGIYKFLKRYDLSYSLYTKDILWTNQFKESYQDIITKKILITQRNYNNVS